MNEVRVSSWNELQDRLLEGAWMPTINRFRSPCAFRGLSCCDYRLETSLMRLGGHYVDMERHLLRNFRKYALRTLIENDSVWYWLSVGQHHGLPTRLLDWSYSPFVAMHFATSNLERFDVDGVIWAVNFKAAHAHLPRPLRRELEEIGADVFTVEMLADAIESLAHLERLAEEDFVLFFEPPSLDDRIVNQFALFSLISRPTACLSDWLEGHPEVWRKIVIPATLKWEIRDKLDQANITERVLFPGLDGLSAWLRRQYTPKA